MIVSPAREVLTGYEAAVGRHYDEAGLHLY
jgi:hypothetical protein